MDVFIETLNYPRREGMRLGYGGSGHCPWGAGTPWVTSCLWCVACRGLWITSLLNEWMTTEDKIHTQNSIPSTDYSQFGMQSSRLLCWILHSVFLSTLYHKTFFPTLHSRSLYVDRGNMIIIIIGDNVIFCDGGSDVFLNLAGFRIFPVLSGSQI